jgi:hypothetical protein
MFLLGTQKYIKGKWESKVGMMLRIEGFVGF